MRDRPRFLIERAAKIYCAHWFLNGRPAFVRCTRLPSEVSGDAIEAKPFSAGHDDVLDDWESQRIWQENVVCPLLFSIVLLPIFLSCSWKRKGSAQPNAGRVSGAFMYADRWTVWIRWTRQFVDISLHDQIGALRRVDDGSLSYRCSRIILIPTGPSFWNKIRNRRAIPEGGADKIRSDVRSTPNYYRH
jgi:hypothetical protein